MKKFQFLSLFLTLCLLMQCLALPAAATETAQPSNLEPTGAVYPTEPKEIPFGSESILMGCNTIDGMKPLAGSDRRLETAQSAFLYEINSDTVVYAYNPDLKVHPGTLAKLVLALVVLENCELEDQVIVTEGIQSYLPMSAHTVEPHLESFEETTVEDLLYAVMLQNANDAAVALAHHVTKTTDAFLTLMNNRVKAMGCTNTEFGNISGLFTAQSYSTARDMAKIVREAIKNETFKEIFGTSRHTMAATNTVGERKLVTQNYMMDESILPDFYDTRQTGGFATYHETIGASVACTAINKSGNLHYIGVVMGAIRTFAENGWSVVSWGNFNEATDLFEFGFDNFKVNRIIYEGMSLSQFNVSGGANNAVGIAQVNVDSVVPKSAQMDNLRMSFKVKDGMLSAPIKEGDLIATMSISYLNSVMAEAEVFAMRDVKAADETGVTIYSTAARSDTEANGFLSVLGTICVIILGAVGVYLAYNSYMRSKIRAQRRRRRQNRRRTR